MSQTEKPETAQTIETQPAAQDPESVVDTLFDLVEAWAVYGLTLGKSALETTAKALERTAVALDRIASRLEKKPA